MLNLKKWTAVGFGSLLLASSSVLSRFLGLIRDFSFSKVFGTGLEGDFALDAYFAAFRIPDLLYTFLVAGAMTAAFIPIYTKLMDEPKKASLFASRVLHLLLILLLVSSCLLWLFTPYLVPLIAPGFDADVMKTAVNLTRIMLLSPIFLGLSSVFQGVENSHQRFWGIAMAPIVYNASIIIAAWFFGPEFGVYALAWGVVLGSFLHFLVQVPGVFKCKFKYQFSWNFKGKELKEFIRLTLPRLFGISVTQLSLFVDTILASLLAFGSLSVFNYALNLQSLPYGVVAVSLSVAVFARLSKLVNRKEEFAKTMRDSTHTILFWVLPAILGIFILREEIVMLVLSGGAFSAEATAMTSKMLGVFIWASLGQSMVPLFARAFYALHETKLPVMIAFVSVVLNIFVSYSLTQIYDFEVWALAFSAVLSSSLNAFLLVIFLGSFSGIASSKFFHIKKTVFLILNTALMAGLVLLLGELDYVHLYIRILVMAGAGASFYLLMSRFTKTIPALPGS